VTEAEYFAKIHNTVTKYQELAPNLEAGPFDQAMEGLKDLTLLDYESAKDMDPTGVIEYYWVSVRSALRDRCCVFQKA
jgi:hypothetical protein